MPTPLPVQDSTLPALAWAAFVSRRDGLVAQMEMATCDGCDGCGLRCMDGFTISETEYDAALAYVATCDPDFVARVAAQPKTLPWPGAEETGATVTFCRWRDSEQNNCSIYPARPTVCRLFGHTKWLPCPIEAVKHTPDGAAELWGEYRTFERKTWDGWAAHRAGLSER